MTAQLLEQREPNCELEIAGETFVCDPSGCLYWPEQSCMIVSDLHLEKGSSFATRGRLIPPYDTGATLDQLQLRLDYWQPKIVISLGDSFHDADASSRIPQQYHSQLEAMIEGRNWIWIRGNHDPKAPDNLSGEDAIELAIGAITFHHEPVVGTSAGEIAGHLHPAAKIRRRGKSVRRRCFVGDGTRLIMPSFGAFTGGLNVRHEAFNGMFLESDLHAWVMGRNSVFQIHARQLVG
ncbi:MAG: ligase-associated DNA damage response endonuclease PdeM [Rhizobiaceae bacterium]|nr:ligase-associated DNA damage response endonuclease PdeM [Rhizobiaceae bacterium]